ncbi:Scr1 family TA system antitoxin-like transcriptional regulator [Nocardiopsis sp. MG754419]|uniref:helix-turn-helix domain-containing protein n=1 Tax=Nocardiopsis sp. MG754419 TaxID=2259865 RepID=UPI001BA8BF99|nr:Scr1 family TA system antitoxin-like transcriptional regulator [Nocardiopsis sp. MG754419]MBR8741073.1 XRE family transcriptional regulator [Nocardiopsis sp. MG754419]
MSNPPFHESLKRYRVLKGLTQEQLAAHLGCSAASVSRWARGHSLPFRETADQLDRLLEADGKLISSWKLAKSGRSTPEWASSLSAVEEGARTLQCVSPVLVPGYLQCEEYAEWLFRLGWPLATDEQIAHLTQVRTTRLNELPRLRVAAVFPVTALLGSPPQTHKAQALHLLRLMEERSVSIHLVPEGSILATITSPLLVFRLHSGETVVSSDHVNGNVIYDDSDPEQTASLIMGAMAVSLPAGHSQHILEGFTT